MRRQILNPYQIKFKASAAKEFQQLSPKLKTRLRLVIEELSTEARPNGVKKLKGYEDLYRLRVGDYRIVYSIEDVIKIVHIIKIGHRRDVYR